MFVKHHRTNAKNGIRTSYYYCNRSGYYNKQEDSLRNIKNFGSNKINGMCPANIKLIQKDEKCAVSFTKNHIGHTNDLGQLKISEAEWVAIASKLVNKIPMSVIFNNKRFSY